MVAQAETGAWICGIGMVTPVGDCAAQTAASVRAGICRYQESSVYNKRFTPMTLALLPADILPPLDERLLPGLGLTSRQIQMLRLAGPALSEALAGTSADEPLPLFLAGPEPLGGGEPAIAGGFLDHLGTQAGLDLDREASRLFMTGRAGGIEALAAALDALARGRKRVLVGGVDSCRDLAMLAAWDQEDRVLAAGVMDGFVPGEAACFLVLGSERDATDSAPGVRIHPPGVGSEVGHRYSPEPHRGDGLDSAVRSALEASGTQRIHTVLCSLNGESLGAKEWGVAALRNQSAFADPLRIDHPADCFGDTGAAVGPLLIALAALGMEAGHIEGPCLIWCASDSENRGALCVSPEE